MLTTIARKFLIALTGLFLCLFLAVHLLGNLQLFLPESEAEVQFNWYAGFLSEQPLIEVAAILTYTAIVAHAILAALLSRRNRTARGTGYQAKAPDSLAPWHSRTMGALGIVILIFLIVHMWDFWYPFKFGLDIGTDAEGRRDLFGLVTREFQSGWKVVFYIVGVVAVGLHVAHGFYSGLRSLGLYHPGYAAWGRRLGYAFAAIVTLGFATIPVFFFLAR